MIVEVIKPQVFLPSVHSVRCELAKCAAAATVSRGKLGGYHVHTSHPQVHLRSLQETYVECNIAHKSLQEAGNFKDAEQLISRLLNFKPHPHESVLEHGNFTVTFRISRICTHQLVRHRIAGITQESTRYVPYHKHDILTLIKPMRVSDEYLGSYKVEWDRDKLVEGHCPRWVYWAAQQVIRYGMLVNGKLDGNKWKREDARYELPHMMPAWIVFTTNLRQWRHMVAHRDQKKASPEMQYIFGEIRRFLGDVSPVLLENLEGENRNGGGQVK